MVRQSLPCRFTCLPREIRWSHRSLRMIFQWAKDIDGSIQSAISLLATYVNTLHTRTVASIFAFPAILVLFICSTSASFPASIFSCGQLFIYTHQASFPEGRSVSHERLLHPLRNSVDAYRRLVLMLLSSVCVRGAVLCAHGLPSERSLGKYAARFTRTRMLLHSIGHLGSTMFFIMKQVPDGKSRPESSSTKSRFVYAPYVLSGDALPE